MKTSTEIIELLKKLAKDSGYELRFDDVDITFKEGTLFIKGNKGGENILAEK